MKTILTVLVAVGIVAGGVAVYGHYHGGDPPAIFRTVPVKKGDITAVVGA